MKRVIVYCEGPTEELFINRLIVPYMASKDVFVTASNCGGVSKYSIIKKHVINMCRNDKGSIVTTMLDLYGLHSDIPGYDVIGKDNISPIEKVHAVEASIKADIGERNFIPFLVLHEFEALLFSDPMAFGNRGLSEKQIKEIVKIKEEFSNPEEINHGYATAPSRRIMKIFPNYNKVVDGYNIAQSIGINKMRNKCSHFDEWLKEFER